MTFTTFVRAEENTHLSRSCYGNILTKDGTSANPRLVWRTDKRTLWRGDGKDNVQQVFANGMKSNAMSRGYAEPEREFDWGCHKVSSFRSNFVSTTFKKDTALNFLANGSGWIYEIVAPGGIDQQRSIGSDNSTFEQEISFPGGIQSKYVKQACRYEKYELVADSCIDNPKFKEPSWVERPDDVAASPIRLTHVVPKADCSKPDVAAITPPSLCSLVSVR